jgi:hypothetical protein
VTGCVLISNLFSLPCNSSFTSYACSSDPLGTCINGLCSPSVNHTVCAVSGPNITDCQHRVCDPAGAFGVPDVFGCVTLNLTEGTTCNTGNPCLHSETCASGQCTNGIPVICNISLNPCINSTCIPSEGGCVDTPTFAPCNPVLNTSCVDDYSCDLHGYCVGQRNTSKCNAYAANLCVLAFCDYADGCVYANVSCTHHVGQCTHPECDQATGLCVQIPLPDGDDCSDGDLCTQGDHCLNGTCVSGADQLCANQTIINQCTIGFCNATSGQCIVEPHPLIGTSCVPSVFGCVLPGEIQCDNDLHLTCEPDPQDDSCIYAPCNVTSDCPSPGFCSQVSCNVTTHVCHYAQISNSSAVCDDSIDCTFDYCDTGTDLCVHDNITLTGYPCDDLGICTSNSVCFLGTCALGTPVTCPASNTTCMTPTCSSMSGCGFTPMPNVSCTTNSFCVKNEHCDINGVCVPGWVRSNCALYLPPPPSPCYVPYCNLTSDTCAYLQMSPGASCGGFGCVGQGQCAANGTCINQTASPMSCAPRPCYTSGCSSNGTCTYTPTIGSPCSPTTSIPCQSGGLCVGMNPTVCVPILNDTLCDDGNICSDDECSLIAGDCVYTPAGSNTICIDPCYSLSECSNTNFSCIGVIPSGVCSECIGKRVGEICNNRQGYCYQDVCYSCPNNNSNVLIATLVFNRLTHDIARLEACNKSSLIPPLVWSYLHNGSFYSARNMTTCAQLINPLLYAMENVTAILDAAVIIAGASCPDVNISIWPSQLYFGWLIHEDVHDLSLTDRDYNDFTLGARITHIYNQSKLINSFIELYPTSRGTFYTHKFLLFTNKTASLFSSWKFSRYHHPNSTLITSPTTHSTGPAAPLVLINSTAMTIGPQGPALPLTQRIANTIPSKPCFAPYYFIHLLGQANTNAAPPPMPCNGTHYPFRLDRLLNADEPSEPPHYNATSYLLNPGRAIYSHFVSNPLFRFTTEGTPLSTLCPLFANCTPACCDNWSYSCAYGNPTLARMCN